MNITTMTGGRCVIHHGGGLPPCKLHRGSQTAPNTQPSASLRCRSEPKAGRQAVQRSCQERPCARQFQSRKVVVCHAAAEVAQLEEEVYAGEELLPGGIKKLSITVPADKVAKAWQQAIKLEGRNHDFPGFRTGKKVPDALVLQRVGKEAVAQRAISNLIQDSLPVATRKYAPQAYEDSLIIDTPPDAALSFDHTKDFHYSSSLTLQPEVKWKGDYKKLKIEMQASPSEEELKAAADEKIKAGLKDVGSLRIVQNRGLEIGDVAVIDIDLRRKEDGEIIEGSQQTGKQLDTAAAQDTVELPGFIEDIQGMVVGDKRELDYTLPDTWWEPTMKGTQVLCNVHLRELFMWELPKLTDQVAKALLPESKDVADFEQQVLDLEQAVQEQLRVQELHSTVCKAVADLVDIEIPEFLYRTIGENEYQAELLSSQANGTLSKEQVEQLATEDLLLKYMENREEHLRDLVRVTVGMEAIWQEQDLSIDEEAAKAEMEAARQEALKSGDELDEDKLAAQVFEAMKGAAIIAWLIEQGEVVEVSANAAEDQPTDAPAQLE